MVRLVSFRSNHARPPVCVHRGIYHDDETKAPPLGQSICAAILAQLRQEGPLSVGELAVRLGQVKARVGYLVYTLAHRRKLCRVPGQKPGRYVVSP